MSERDIAESQRQDGGPDDVTVMSEARDDRMATTGISNGETERPLSTSDVANAMQGRSDARPSAAATDEASHLLPEDRLNTYRDRWSSIQTTFVDEPKESVEQADSLVAEVIQTLAQRFAEERDALEHQWSSGGDASTEDLRQALQHYRSFFQRLLAA